MSEHIYSFEEEKSLKEELKKIVNDHPNNYTRMITAESRKYLKDYLEFKTPLLNDKKYLLSTKCYWVLNDLIDFPKCKTCGRAN